MLTLKKRSQLTSARHKTSVALADNRQYWEIEIVFYKKMSHFRPLEHEGVILQEPLKHGKVNVSLGMNYEEDKIDKKNRTRKIVFSIG
jgi:hypothetical protein